MESVLARKGGRVHALGLGLPVRQVGSVASARADAAAPIYGHVARGAKLPAPGDVVAVIKHQLLPRARNHNWGSRRKVAGALVAA